MAITKKVAIDISGKNDIIKFKIRFDPLLELTEGLEPFSFASMIIQGVGLRWICTVCHTTLYHLQGVDRQWRYAGAASFYTPVSE